MAHRFVVAFFQFAIASCAILGTSTAHAQGIKASKPFLVDKALVNAGKNVWSAKGCMACHMIGKEMAAPDLNGLYERRSAEWIKSWLKDPAPFFESDDAIKAMVKQYNGMKMPNLKLTEAEIDQVMHYIASQQKSKK